MDLTLFRHFNFLFFLFFCFFAFTLFYFVSCHVCWVYHGTVSSTCDLLNWLQHPSEPSRIVLRGTKCKNKHQHSVPSACFRPYDLHALHPLSSSTAQIISWFLIALSSFTMNCYSFVVVVSFRGKKKKVSSVLVVFFRGWQSALLFNPSAQTPVFFTFFFYFFIFKKKKNEQKGKGKDEEELCSVQLCLLPQDWVCLPWSHWLLIPVHLSFFPFQNKHQGNLLPSQLCLPWSPSASSYSFSERKEKRKNKKYVKLHLRLLHWSTIPALSQTVSDKPPPKTVKTCPEWWNVLHPALPLNYYHDIF